MGGAGGGEGNDRRFSEDSFSSVFCREATASRSGMVRATASSSGIVRATVSSSGIVRATVSSSGMVRDVHNVKEMVVGF